MDVISDSNDLRYNAKKKPRGTTIRAVPSGLARRWIDQGLAKHVSAAKSKTESRKQKKEKTLTTENTEKKKQKAENRKQKKEKPTMDSLKKEIQAYCNQAGIDYSSSDTKAELLKKIEQNKQ